MSRDAMILRALGLVLVPSGDGGSKVISGITNTRAVMGHESAELQHGGLTAPRGLGWKPNKPLMRKAKAMCRRSREGIARQNFPVSQERGRVLFAQLRRALAAA